MRAKRMCQVQVGAVVVALLLVLGAQTSTATWGTERAPAAGNAEVLAAPVLEANDGAWPDTVYRLVTHVDAHGVAWKERVAVDGQELWDLLEYAAGLTGPTEDSAGTPSDVWWSTRSHTGPTNDSCFGIVMVFATYTEPVYTPGTPTGTPICGPFPAPGEMGGHLTVTDAIIGEGLADHGLFGGTNVGNAALSGTDAYSIDAWMAAYEAQPGIYYGLLFGYDGVAQVYYS